MNVPRDGRNALISPADNVARNPLSVADAMKPLEEAAEQNLKRMRKELTRVVKEVGQRFSGPETEDD